MHAQTVEVISKIANRTLKDRQQVPEIIKWTKENEAHFNELLESFDQTITMLNDLSENDIPADFINTLALKKALGSRRLPTVSEMSESDSPFNLFGTLKHVSRMMSRGETTKEEPWLAFHTKKIDKESLVVGAIIHTSEEYYLAHANVPPTIHRGMIEFAVEEVSSLDPNSPIWQTVSDKNRLNWIDSGNEFSQQFRTRNNLS